MKTRIFVLAIFLLGGFLMSSGQTNKTYVEKTKPATENLLIDKNNMGDITIPISNYPDPFVRYTTIQYYLSSPGWAQVLVYDQETGNETGDVLILVNENQEAGLKEVKFDSQGLPPGQYYAELRFNNTCMRDIMTKYPLFSNKKIQH